VYVMTPSTTSASPCAGEVSTVTVGRGKGEEEKGEEKGTFYLC